MTISRNRLGNRLIKEALQEELLGEVVGPQNHHEESDPVVRWRGVHFDIDRDTCQVVPVVGMRVWFRPNSFGGPVPLASGVRKMRMIRRPNR